MNFVCALLPGLTAHLNLPPKEVLKYQKKLLSVLLSENEDSVVKAGCLEALASFSGIPVQALPSQVTRPLQDVCASMS